jgi:hypothetical protein
MLKSIMPKMGASAQSVEAIVAPLTDIVNKLAKHAEAKIEESHRHLADARLHEALSADAAHEAATAEIAAGKIGELIGAM